MLNIGNRITNLDALAKEWATWLACLLTKLTLEFGICKKTCSTLVKDNMQVRHTICNMIKSLHHSLAITLKYNIIESQPLYQLNNTVQSHSFSFCWCWDPFENFQLFFYIVSMFTYDAKNKSKWIQLLEKWSI